MKLLSENLTNQNLIKKTLTYIIKSEFNKTKCNLDYLEFDDAYQEALLHLFLTIPKLDTSQNHHKQTKYLVTSIRNRIKAYIKQQFKVMSPLFNIGHPEEWVDNLEGPEESTQPETLIICDEFQKDKAGWIEEVMAENIAKRRVLNGNQIRLSLVEKYAIKYLYPKLTPQEIAYKYGITSAAVSYLFKTRSKS